MLKVSFPTSDEDSSTPDYGTVTSTAALRTSFRPLTRIHLLLTQQQFASDSTGPVRFRPLTRIHLLLTPVFADAS